MTQATGQPTPPASVGIGNFMSLFTSIMLPMFLAMVDQTIVAAALPAIAGDLGGADRISWIVIAYLIAATIASPVYGRLGDVLGRKRLMFVALTILMAASVLCGFSTNIAMLTVGRVIQGFGGGGLMTLSQALIGETVPPRQRARYQGFLASVAVFSTAFGAVAGGFLTEHFGWRSVFFVSVPVGLLAMVLVRRLAVRAPKAEPFRFDGVGLLLFVVFITSTLVMLHQVQDFTPAVLWPSLALLALALVAIVLLVQRERRTKHPLFPISLFRDPVIWRCDAMALGHGAALVALVTFLPIYLRVGLGAAPGEIGLSLLPVTACVPIGSILTGLLVSRSGRTAIFPSVGLLIGVPLLIVAGLSLEHLSATQLSLLLGLSALFMGTVMGVVQVSVQSAAGLTMLGTAAASVQFSRSIGAAVGTAVVGIVLFAVMSATDSDAAHMFAAILQQGPDVLLTLPEAQRVAIPREIVGAFRAAFFTIAAFEAGVLVLAWSLPLRRI
jgi:MFS family permease